jgi:hypothetical protein
MPRPERPPRLAVYAGCVCALAAVAAVVSFIRGEWVGIVWVLLAGLTSNMTWYYARRGGRTAGTGTGTRTGTGTGTRAGIRTGTRTRKAGAGPGAANAGCANGGACGGCVKTTSEESC